MERKSDECVKCGQKGELFEIKALNGVKESRFFCRAHILERDPSYFEVEVFYSSDPADIEAYESLLAEPNPEPEAKPRRSRKHDEEE